jgi:hypothetical protein
MTLDELEARIDGPIPERVRRAVRATATATPAARAATIATVKGLKRQSAVPAMAKAIADLFETQGCATESDLRRLGFTDKDIQLHGPAAKALARQQVRGAG